MKLATFNVNGIRARLPNLLEWLERESPDVTCLEELKVHDETFPAMAIKAAALADKFRPAQSITSF